eukprot:1180291-Prorocentrum_minimum.AAC.1
MAYSYGGIDTVSRNHTVVPIPNHVITRWYRYSGHTVALLQHHRLCPLRVFRPSRGRHMRHLLQPPGPRHVRLHQSAHRKAAPS